MLDFFLIFSKSGIVLFYYINDTLGNGLNDGKRRIIEACNALIRNLLLEEKYSQRTHVYEQWQIQYLMDNEFELVYIAGYRKILQLGYVDKLLTETQLLFRDKNRQQFGSGFLGTIISDIDAEYQKPFQKIFRAAVSLAEAASKQEQIQSRQLMKTFQDSDKSKKTASLLEKTTPASLLSVTNKPEAAKPVTVAVVDKKAEIERNREMFIQRQQKQVTSPKAGSAAAKKDANAKKQKLARQWDLAGTNKDFAELDFSKKPESNNSNGAGDGSDRPLDANMAEQFGSYAMVGKSKDLQELGEDIGDAASDSGEEQEAENNNNDNETWSDNDGDEDDDEKDHVAEQQRQQNNKNVPEAKSGGMFGMFKSLVGVAGKRPITAEQLQPLLEHMRMQLIDRNVATEVAQQCCTAVSEKLLGKTLGTFEAVRTVVRQTMIDTLTRILLPENQVNILRQIRVKRLAPNAAAAAAGGAKQRPNPYVVVFCGVNGVGKSTNLAKITFWLLENDLRVLIAACDTFRAGAVEQLRTHARHLNDLHPPNKISGDPQVKLFERGYGKDAATIAMEAVGYARDANYDVVLVDTAGRMQDNEPLMKALAKLVKVNEPDLLLFVGEALVGNEAVDQLVKFNRALADHSQSDKPRQIDGIVLTKFDTIDDKVGAAVSMSHITNKPIMFVGTGQTYADLKSINVGAVVSALMK